MFAVYSTFINIQCVECPRWQPAKCEVDRRNGSRDTCRPTKILWCTVRFQGVRLSGRQYTVFFKSYPIFDHFWLRRLLGTWKKGVFNQAPVYMIITLTGVCDHLAAGVSWSLTVSTAALCAHKHTFHYMPHHPGLHWSTPGGISSCLKTGMRTYPDFWNQEMTFLQVPNINRRLQKKKRDHHRDTRGHVNTLSNWSCHSARINNFSSLNISH